MALDQRILEIVIKAQDEASKTIKGIGDEVTNTKTRFEDLSKNLKIAGGILTGVGVAGALAVKDWATAAGQAQAEMARVDTLIRAVADEVPGSFTQITKTIRDTAKAFIQLGFDDEETAQVLAKNIAITKDVGEAHKVLAAQADLARFKNIGLAEAGQAVQLAMLGNKRILKQLGIEIDDNATKTDILAAIQAKTAGQAEAFAKTYQGAMARMSVSTENLREALGEKLLPIFTNIIDKVVAFVNQINDINPAILPTIGVIVAVGSAFALVVGPILLLLGFLPAIAAGFGIISGVALPVVGILAAVAAVGALIFLNWNAISGVFQEVSNTISEFMAIAKPFVDEFLMIATQWIMEMARVIGEQLNVAFVALQNALLPIMPTLQFLGEMIAVVAGVLIMALGGAILLLIPILGSFLEGAIMVFTSVVQTIAGAVQIIQGIFGIFGGLLVGFITGDFTIFKKGINDVWEGIKAIFNAATTFLTGMMTLWFGGLQTLFNKVMKETILGQIVTGFWADMNKMFTEGTASVFNLLKAGLDRLTQLFESFKQGVVDILRQIKFPRISVGEGVAKVAGREIKYPTINIEAVSYFQKGGFVGSTGLAMLHAGEFVLSKDMLKGRAEIPSQVQNTFNQPINIEATVSNELDFDLLGYKLAWELRNAR